MSLPRSSRGRSPRTSRREEAHGGVRHRLVQSGCDQENRFMVRVGLWVRLEARPGKEVALETFLNESLADVQDEPATVAWFAIRLGPSIFGIFDAFPDEGGRQTHLAGRVAAALIARAPELLSRPPSIENVDLVAVKLPREVTTADRGRIGWSATTDGPLPTKDDFCDATVEVHVRYLPRRMPDD